jgi:hypothetical protein
MNDKAQQFFNQIEVKTMIVAIDILTNKLMCFAKILFY